VAGPVLRGRPARLAGIGPAKYPGVILPGVATAE
jgi:hypothetical protein